MKRIKKFTPIILIFLLSFLMFPSAIYAGEIDEYDDSIAEYDLSAFELLDDDTTDILEELGIDDFDYESISNISAEKLLKYAGEIIGEKAESPLKAFILLLLFIILSSIVKSFDAPAAINSSGEAYVTISNLIIAVYLATGITPTLSLACSTLKLCSDFTYAFFPAFCIVCASSGNTAASFSANSSLLCFSQLLNFISSDVFMPVTNCFLGIGVCSSIRKDMKLSSVINAMKTLITKSISTLAAVFVSFLSLKTAVASRTDALGLRSVRFAVNSVVPVIGSSISEGLLSIQSYSSLVKTGVGVVGIIAICLIFLPAIIGMAVWRASLTGASICADVFFESESVSVLNAFNSVLLIINVLLILSMVTTVISLGILVACKTVS